MARKIRNSEITRISGDLKQVINQIKAKYISEGKQPPTNTQITKDLAKRIRDGGKFNDLFIRL